MMKAINVCVLIS